MKKRATYKDDLKKLIAIHHRRLQKLKERQAACGLSVDPSVLIEIEDIEATLSELQLRLEDKIVWPGGTDFAVPDEVMLDISVNRSVLVELVSQSFSEEALKDLCFTHFPEIYDNLGSSCGKNVVVRLLIEFCQRQGLMRALIPLIKAHNPYQFANYAKELLNDFS